MTRIVCGLLATVVLACMAAAPPRDNVRILWTIETPIVWMAEVLDGSKHVLVVSTNTPQADDPLWWDVEQWARQDAVPSLSPLKACFMECKDFCAPQQVKKVKFTAGEPPSCECECYPLPPVTNPPPGNGSAD